MSLTPEQFNKLVTKDYFEEKLEEKLKNLATKEDIDKVLTAVDGIAHKHQGFEVEMAANQGAHNRLGKNIAGHEIRIKKLELPA
ncbi:MAG: hypothetical protein HYV53_01080 [Parcubacteria group bacterium]|nr:hypothetical protein [Parcubacteria group bacterium]